MLKIDLHVHTNRSRDSLTDLKTAARVAALKGLDGIAVTDHDNVLGSPSGVRVGANSIAIIPGVEVSTRQGHLLALGVTDQLAPKRDLEETIDEVRRMGGVAIASHPYRMFSHSIPPRELRVSRLDAIEVLNSSYFPFSMLVAKSEKLAEELKLPKTAGSDSHMPESVGNAYTKIDAPSPDLPAILKAIREGKTEVEGRPTPLERRLRHKIDLRLRKSA